MSTPLPTWLDGCVASRSSAVSSSQNNMSLMKLIKSVARNLPQVEAVPRNSPEDDRQAIGMADATVREMKGHIRAARSLLESKNEKA